MALSDLTEPTGRKKGPPCSVCTLLAQLDETERDALIGLLKDPLWRYADISRELRAEGYEIAGQTLGKHSRGDCTARTQLR